MTVINESALGKNCQFMEYSLKGSNHKVEVYDNCLDNEVFKKIQTELLSDRFAWFYNEIIVPSELAILKGSPIEGRDTDLGVYRFVHRFYMVLSGYIFSWPTETKLITPALQILDPRAWVRVDASLGYPTTEHACGGWHYDINDGNKLPDPRIKSAILYFNTNNGYTLFETGDKIKSVENRLIIFPCDIFHTGVTQTDTKTRVLLNFNFFPPQEGSVQ